MTEQTKTPPRDGDWHVKPPESVRTVKDAMDCADYDRHNLPGVIQVYAHDWDRVILADALATQSALLAEMREALEPFASEYEIADECGELQHWPESEVARCKAAYDALARAADLMASQNRPAVHRRINRNAQGSNSVKINGVRSQVSSPLLGAWDARPPYKEIDDVANP